MSKGPSHICIVEADVVIPILRKQRLEDHDFKASIGCMTPSLEKMTRGRTEADRYLRILSRYALQDTFFEVVF